MQETAVARADISVFGSKTPELGCTSIHSTPMSTVSTKADDIAGILEDEIVGGAIPPGTVLRQETLSERFEVSRTPVREALRRLAATPAVSLAPHRRARAAPLARGGAR